MLPAADFKSEKLTCISCIQGKFARAKFGRRDSRNPRKFGLVHSDVCGPFEVNAIGGFRFFVTFIDDFSGYCWVYLIREKSEVCQIQRAVQVIEKLVRLYHWDPEIRQWWGIFFERVREVFEGKWSTSTELNPIHPAAKWGCGEDE